LGSSSEKKACAISTYAENGIDAHEPPAFGELLVDQRIDLELLAHDALDQIAEEGRLGIAILAALDLLA
jgi:hypothetical protein